MGQHDPAHVAPPDAEPLELGPDLLLARNRLPDGEAEERLPAREVPGLGDPGGLAGVDDDDALRMLDREGVDRERLGPLPVDERVEPAPPAATGPVAPAGREGDGSGLDRVDVHETRFRVGWGAVGAKPRRSSSVTPSASCRSMGPPVMSSR